MRASTLLLLFPSIVACGPEEPVGDPEPAAAAALARPLPIHTPYDLLTRRRIQYSPLADCRIVSAADDLDALLEQITGQTWTTGPWAAGGPIPQSGITVGTSQELGYSAITWVADSEGFVVRTHPNGIVLTGAAPLGVEHAVWRLANALGYRAFFPTPTWEVAPSVTAANDTVTLNTKVDPPYVVHQLGLGSLLNPGDDATTVDACGASVGQQRRWERRNGIRGKSIQSGHFWKAHLCSDLAYQPLPTDANPDLETIEEWYEVPGNTWVSRDLADYCDVGGDPDPIPRLCVTDPTAQDLVAAHVQHTLDTTTQDAASVSAQDGVGGWLDGCASDAGLTPSDRMLTLARATDAAVTGGVGFLAYGETAEAPSLGNECTDVPGGAVGDCGDVWLVATDALAWNGASAETLLADWAPFVEDDHRLSYSYWSVTPWSRSLPGSGKILPTSEAIAELEGLAAAGAGGSTGESTNAWGPYGLAYYLWARYVVDPGSYDQEALTEEFYRMAFGVDVDLSTLDPATAPGIVKFYDLLDGDPEPLPTADLVGAAYEALAEAWDYTGPGGSGGTGDAAVDARLRDLFVYVRYLDLYVQMRATVVDPGDCTAGAALTPRQSAVDALVAHLYRVRARWMTDVEGAMYAAENYGMDCELDALADWYAAHWTSPCWDGTNPQSAIANATCLTSHWPDESDVNGAVVSDGEIAGWIDGAPSSDPGFTPWTDLADLVPAPGIALSIGEASRSSMHPDAYHQSDTVYDAWLDPATEGLRLEITAGLRVADASEATWVHLTLFDPAGVQVDDVPVPNDGVQQHPVLCPDTCVPNATATGCDCTGAPPTGHYTLAITGGDFGFNVDLDPAVRQATLQPATSHLSHRTVLSADWDTHYISDLYFYVPNGTAEVSYYQDGRSLVEYRDPATGDWMAWQNGAWIDHDSRVGDVWSAPDVNEGYVTLTNPLPATGSVWRFFQCMGRCYPANVPPIVAYHPSELLLPASVVAADGL